MNIKTEKPKRTPPGLTHVVRTQEVSPAIRRVVLGGESLRTFPHNRNGAHIKVFLPLAGQNQPVLPTLGPQGPIWPASHLRPVTRTYSVRHYCPEKNELAVDFVMHGDDSPAARWAAQAKPGDFIGIAGPGGPNPLLKPAQYHLLVGDLTALPAIAALLEELPDHATGLAYLWASREDEKIPLQHPCGVTLRWIIGPESQRTSQMLNAVRTQLPLAWRSHLSAFVAGENALVLQVRQYLCDAFALNKRSMYATPYWRSGQDEEAYHQERHRIMDEVY